MPATEVLENCNDKGLKVPILLVCGPNITFPFGSKTPPEYLAPPAFKVRPLGIISEYSFVVELKIPILDEL
jgi:hypothetical protein